MKLFAFLFVVWSGTGFIAQWGIASNPDDTKKWIDATIVDDPVLASNVRGTIAFAAAGENTRSSQVFVNMADNQVRLIPLFVGAVSAYILLASCVFAFCVLSQFLDVQGFAPIGRVLSGFDVLLKLHRADIDQLDYTNGGDKWLIKTEVEVTRIVSVVSSYNITSNSSANVDCGAVPPVLTHMKIDISRLTFLFVVGFIFFFSFACGLYRRYGCCFLLRKKANDMKNNVGRSIFPKAYVKLDIQGAYNAGEAESGIELEKTSFA